jgi:hypothetical protein
VEVHVRFGFGVAAQLDVRHHIFVSGQLND